jgi:hypothetical protein
MSQLKIGTLIFDDEDQEWGIIIGILDEKHYNTSWAKSTDQVLNDFDFELDRFHLYEV